MSPSDREETEQELLAPQAQTIDNATLALLNKSELDQQVATAKKYPRKLTVFLNTATALATQDGETADECIYALPRDNKVIEGPSARFAEIIAYAWGNCRAGARVIGEDEEFVTAMGSFFDMEQNIHIGYEVKRRIVNKHGKRYNSDMIGTTANAACSIALRNAILKGIPKAMWRKIYERARQTIAGDIKTLTSRRDQMLKAFGLMGAKPEQIFSLLEVKGVDDITLDHLVTLRGIYNAIREGETTVERAFAPKDTEDKNLAEKSKAAVEKIKEKYAQQPQPQTEPVRELRVGPAPTENGASQPPTSPQTGEKTVTDPAAATGDTAAAGSTAAPSETQEAAHPEDLSPSPAGPEGAGSFPSPSGPEEPALEDHGVPNIFDEPARGKSSRKR